jgi:hypothetical protein
MLDDMRGYALAFLVGIIGCGGDRARCCHPRRRGRSAAARK